MLSSRSSKNAVESGCRQARRTSLTSAFAKLYAANYCAIARMQKETLPFLRFLATLGEIPCWVDRRNPAELPMTRPSRLSWPRGFGRANCPRLSLAQKGLAGHIARVSQLTRRFGRVLACVPAAQRTWSGPLPATQLAQKLCLSSLRLLVSVLTMMLCTWVLMVPSERNSSCAIVRLSLPSMTMASTSRSRFDRLCAVA